jgi:hypothetical protein
MKTDASQDVQTDQKKEVAMLAGTIMIDMKVRDTIKINTIAEIGMQVLEMWITNVVNPILEKTKIIAEVGVMTGRELMIVCKRLESDLMLNLEIKEVGKTTGQQITAQGETNNS